MRHAPVSIGPPTPVNIWPDACPVQMLMFLQASLLSIRPSHLMQGLIAPGTGYHRLI